MSYDDSLGLGHIHDLLFNNDVFDELNERCIDIRCRYLKYDDRTVINDYRLLRLAFDLSLNIHRVRELASLPFDLIGDRSGNIMVHLAGPEKAIANANFVPGGTEALFSSLVILSWTAFETAATGMWIEALNQRPVRLGNRVIGAPKEKGEKDESAIPVKLLRDHGFNLRGKLGTACAYKFRFNTLEGIRDAFKRVFKDEAPIIAVVERQELNELHAVRNVLLHCGGFIDDRFRSRASAKADLVDIASKSRLRLDGARTAEHVLAGCQSAVDLLSEVTAWLDANRSP